MATNALSAVSEAERAEFESVLRSRVLRRSPGVLRIAEYIAKKYLDGQAEEIKEYNIAVDGLGKPPDFDPKRDSIVRVEAHRLRKKLDEFYRTEGSDHILRLVIDTGNYVPRFEAAQEPGIEVLPDRALEEYPAAIVAPPQQVTVNAAPLHGYKWLFRAGIGVISALVAVMAVYSLWPSHPPNVPEPVFLLMGMPAKVTTVGESSGIVWGGDRWFRGGTVLYCDPPYPVTPDTSHAGQRAGNFDYDIPLADIPWEMRLYFGPRAGEGENVSPVAHGFDVFANGVKLLSAQDPQVEGDAPDRPRVRVFRDIRPGPDHLLHISFRNGRKTAYVNAISLVPGQTGRLSPIRLISRATPWIDKDGNAWNPDGEYVTGGRLKVSTKPDAGAFDRNFMMGERYGTFSYAIPVAKGTYTLKLYFVESWWGPGYAGGGGVGKRRFDVYAERQPLLQDFDIFREAGHKPLVKEFHGLKPNADGYIDLSFVPRANYAAVNAAELVEERP
jgi:hypothetical protein